MTDDRIPLWQEHVLKLREFHFKRFSEAQRLGVEFSKLIVTNLIWINAAGLGSLPVVVSFAGLGSAPWSAKFPLVFWPGATFALGLFFALMCALASNLNFNAIAKNADYDCIAEINSLVCIHPDCVQNPEFRQLIESTRDTGLKGAKSWALWVEITYYIAHIFGWLSLSCFVFACYQLVRMSPPSLGQ